MRNGQAKSMAFGGVMAALAVVIMCLGGMIPASTFICPMLAMMLLALVYRMCGRRIAWSWYGAVAVLSALLGPDKEAAAVFIFLGYYPIIKTVLDRVRFGWILKALLFNTAILLMYALLIYLFGMDQIMEEYAQLGQIMTVVMLLMGNVVFFLLDRILAQRPRRRK